MKLYNLEKYKNTRRMLRKNMTKAEAVLWIFIKNKQLEYKFRRQYGIGNYIVDFYCPKLKLIVEVDGATHDFPEVFERDVKRQKHLEKKGFIVKRYNDEEILNDLDGVWEDLYNTCQSIDKRKNDPSFNSSPY